MADVDALYGYDEYHATHQPRVVFDYNEGILMELFWDADGNLFQVQDCKSPMVRFHDWDEENRLRLMIGNSTAGYYGYDAKGERVYKLTSDKGGMEFDGDKVQAYFTWSDATLYPNPYLTITPTGYTKHYYANSERLSTVLGEGGWFLMSKDAISDLTQDEEHDIGHAFDRYSEHFPLGLPSAVLTQNKDIDEQVVQELQYDCPQETLVSIDLDCTMNPNALYSRMYRNLAVNGTETNVYYTHNDHLGSASWITDRYAHPTQYLHYLPYGQLLANQKATTYDERYKFIGKERDMESGYDYFGARYYISPFLHWMSVDPLSDEDPGISPYAYCHWNPVKNVDPDGRDWYEADGEIRWTELKSQQAMDKAKLAGRYLGEAVVIFLGNENECWGTDNTLTGENANPAVATIYGVNGKDDIQTYRGMTTSQSESYSTLNVGDYKMFYQDMATSIYGEKGANAHDTPIAPALTYRITKPDGTEVLDGTKQGVQTTMKGVFMRRTDWNGTASHSSKGCMTIDGRQWRNVEKQLKKSSNIFLRVTR